MTLAHATVELREAAEAAHLEDVACEGNAARARMCEMLTPTAVLALLDRLERAEARGEEAQETPHRVGDVWERGERLVVRELGVDGQPLRLHHDTLGERWWSVRGLVDAGWRRVSRAALDDEAPR